MTISNNTIQTLIFDITGEATDPLSSAHFFLKCQAKEEKRGQFEIANKNLKRNVVFEVKSDVPNFFGPSEIKVESRKKAVYEYKIVPKISGTYVGQVTFTDRGDKKGLDPNKQVYWFTMELKIT